MMNEGSWMRVQIKSALKKYAKESANLNFVKHYKS